MLCAFYVFIFDVSEQSRRAAPRYLVGKVGSGRKGVGHGLTTSACFYSRFAFAVDDHVVVSIPVLLLLIDGFEETRWFGGWCFAADGVYDVITCCCCCCCSPVSTGRDSSTWLVAPAREPRRPTFEDLLLLLGWNAG